MTCCMKIMGKARELAALQEELDRLEGDEGNKVKEVPRCFKLSQALSGFSPMYSHFVCQLLFTPLSAHSKTIYSVFLMISTSHRCKAVLAKLRGLVSLNESLRLQEQQFKATCKVNKYLVFLRVILKGS